MIQLSEDVLYNNKIKFHISQSKILIAEYCVNFNYFNTQRLTEKSVFRFYDSFTHEIIIPNWVDTCLYTKDLVVKYLKNEFCQMMNSEISFEEFSGLLQYYQSIELERQFKIFNKSKFPELITFVSMNLKTHKLAHTLNHPSNVYFIELFRLIIEKYFVQGPYYLPQSLIDYNNQYEYLENKGVDPKITYYDRVCLDINMNTHYLDEAESRSYIYNEIK
jgi:hypothetical protein